MLPLFFTYNTHDTCREQSTIKRAQTRFLRFELPHFNDDNHTFISHSSIYLLLLNLLLYNNVIAINNSLTSTPHRCLCSNRID